MCNDRLRHALLQNQQKLSLLAQQDALTKLANRNTFGEFMELALTRAESSQHLLGLLYIDIDHFKKINDEYGHASGDAVLCEVARRIEQSVRATDIVARLGGDEFAVLVEDVPSADVVEKVAQNIIASLEEGFVLDTITLHVSASIGVAMSDLGTDAKTLLASADTALYEAKAAGRSTYRVASSSASGRKLVV